MKKEITVREVFKSTSEDERDKYLKDKIVKLMIRQQQLECRALPENNCSLCHSEGDFCPKNLRIL